MPIPFFQLLLVLTLLFLGVVPTASSYPNIHRFYHCATNNDPLTDTTLGSPSLSVTPLSSSLIGVYFYLAIPPSDGFSCYLELQPGPSTWQMYPDHTSNLTINGITGNYQ